MNWLKEKIRSWLGISKFNADLLDILETLGEQHALNVSIGDDVAVLIVDVQKLKDYTGITDNEEFMSYGGKKAE